MKFHIIFGLFALLLLGLMTPSMGQTSEANRIVINEIDINPPGNDADGVSEWVELYNPTQTQIDLSGWQVASTTLLKKTLTISQGTVIKPEGYLVFNHVSLWFPDVSEVVELRDNTGQVIDKTPALTDLRNDYSSWQRIWDGVDSDTENDWEFGFYSVGTTNGKIPQVVIEEQTSLSLETDKPNYIFDEVATISGKVSERVFVEKPIFQAAQINLKIFGPDGYFKSVTLYPDYFLSYTTDLGLQQVLGIKEGTYTISAEYGDANTVTTFTVGEEVIITEEKEAGLLTIKTDQQTVFPNTRVIISAVTSEIIPFEGLKFKVYNADNIAIHQGNLFPNLKGERISASDKVEYDKVIAKEDQFFTSILIDTVTPVYGTYRIVGDYGTQHAESTFEVIEDVKEAKLISLTTDKRAYSPGEIVHITGRLNTGWIPAFDLEILQTGIELSTEYIGRGSIDQDTVEAEKVLDAVDLIGDSSFSYDYRIPNNQERLGQYRITVSKDLGSAQAFFDVVNNPDEFVVQTELLKFSTNQEVYNIGEHMVVTGNVIDHSTRTSFETGSVLFTIIDDNGDEVQFLGCPKGTGGTGRMKELCDIPTTVTLSGVPDIAGNFKTEIQISHALFEPGKYTLYGNFDDRKAISTYSFSVNEFIFLGRGDILATTDKDVYGLGDIVYLSGKVSPDAGISVLAVSIYKPDGKTPRETVRIDEKDLTFNMAYRIPPDETLTINSLNPRSVVNTNYGVYRMSISSEFSKSDIFFKVSEDPENDVLSTKPLEVFTNKLNYEAGEKLVVSGKTTKRVQATSGSVPERIHVVVKSMAFPPETIYESNLHSDSTGSFRQTYDLLVTEFNTGKYRVSVNYFDFRDETFFDVNNRFDRIPDQELGIIFELDKQEYFPGDVVHASGGTTKIIAFEQFEIIILKEDDFKISCGSFYCGVGTAPVRIVQDSAGRFTFDYQIPNNADSLGNYEFIVDTDFDVVSKPFTVVETPTITETPQVSVPETKPSKKVIEKFNRIPESEIPITVNTKTVDFESLSPRVIQGSLFTSIRGAESDVNLKVTTESGQCIIGQEEGCMINSSTRIPGEIYKIVEVDDVNYKIRYSGPDVRLEKFTILPVQDNAIIPNITLNVEIIKDDQPTRFYYKVTYNSSE